MQEGQVRVRSRSDAQRRHPLPSGSVHVGVCGEVFCSHRPYLPGWQVASTSGLPDLTLHWVVSKGDQAGSQRDGKQSQDLEGKPLLRTREGALVYTWARDGGEAQAELSQGCLLVWVTPEWDQARTSDWPIQACVGALGRKVQRQAPCTSHVPSVPNAHPGLGSGLGSCCCCMPRDKHQAWWLSPSRDSVKVC